MTLYYADTLPLKQPDVFNQLQGILSRHDISYSVIPDTKDIWCRDYMPIKGANGSLIQFLYWPEYLRQLKYIEEITPPTCYRSLPFANNVRETGIILDGGAMEICGSTGITTERLFTDNPWYNRDDLLAKVKDLLALDTLLVIPVEPGDVTGHVDGVVRFFDNCRVVMNDYEPLGGRLRAYGRKVETLLSGHGLTVEKLPYAPTDEKGPDGMPAAIGCYINFLKAGNLIILPQFVIEDDRIALEKCCEIFNLCAIEMVDCRELALHGGVLNCVSWDF